MRIGKLFIGWRDIPAWEAAEFELPVRQQWRGLFIEWGDRDGGLGLLLMVETTA